MLQAYQLGCTHGLLPLVVMNPPGEEQHLEMDVATAAMLGAGSSMRLVRGAGAVVDGLGGWAVVRLAGCLKDVWSGEVHRWRGWPLC